MVLILIGIVVVFFSLYLLFSNVSISIGIAIILCDLFGTLLIRAGLILEK